MSNISEKSTTRRFSKKITVWSLISLFAIAVYGIATANPFTHEIISALGHWILGLLFTYMGIGYGDHRLAKSMPDLTDVFMTMLSKGRGRRRHDEGEGGPDDTLH